MHHASTGSGEQLKNATFSMQNGVAVVPDSFYVLQPSYNFKPRSFRLGARVLNLQGVKEAKTEPFAVKTGRSLSDEKKRAADHAGIEDVHELPVKKLPGTGRAAVDKLDQMGITNVEQFVERMNDDADDLRKTLKMSDRQWEEATSAAKRLVVEAAPPFGKAATPPAEAAAAATAESNALLLTPACHSSIAKIPKDRTVAGRGMNGRRQLSKHSRTRSTHTPRTVSRSRTAMRAAIAFLNKSAARASWPCP